MIFMRKNQARKSILLLAVACAAGGCATLQPTSVSGPRVNERTYPVLFSEEAERRETSLQALNHLIQQTGPPGAFAPDLQPITATIRSLPANAIRLLQLPKVGTEPTMNEEETREALRRFIRDSGEFIGADPAKLSLVERVDQPDGSKLAIYQQRPFRFPIRGNYGKLEIRFTSDRRILNISSTCIPQAERIQAAFSALQVRPKVDETIKQLRENGLTYKDSNGNTANLKIPAANAINTSGLVIYVVPSESQPDSLEFHLAWEIQPGSGPIKTAYVDAINGTTIAVE
jgi:hypothetical protein